MKKTIIGLVFITLFISNIFAQSGTLEGVELIDTNAVFNVTQVKLLGVDESSSPKRLIYQFTHPGGAIQIVRKSLMSGGKEATNLPAFGAVDLTEPLSEAPHTIKWVTPERVGTNVNFYARPLVSADRHMSDNLIAKSGSIMSNDAFYQMEDELTTSSLMYQFPEEEMEDVEPSYIDSYKNTTIGVGMGGKISYVTTATYNLKPVGERNKGLFGTAYKIDANTNKDHTKTAFGDDPTISYKYTMSGFPQANDPVSGHAVVFGGLKYKKNKSKENSHFYEFMMLTFNNDGDIVNRLRYDSEEPLVVDAVYPIYGENLAPDVNEVTHAIFVAKGEGNKRVSGINRKMRKIFVVDMLTGEIIKQDEVELAYANATVVQNSSLEGDKIALTYYYPAKDRRGLVQLIIGLDGIENIKEIDGESPGFKAINLAEQPFSGLKLVPLYSFDAADGGVVKIEHFATTASSSTGGTINKSQGYMLTKYDANGYLTAVEGIGRLIKGHNKDFIKLADDQLWLMAYENLGNASRLKFMKVNLSDLTVETSTIPDNEFSIAESDYYYDAAAGNIYFLTQKRLGKGVSVFQYKL